MGKIKEFGVCLENREATEYIACARLAEALGYGTAWLAEDYFYRGVFTVASAIACHTTSLQLGIGVVNPYTRHPGLTAMEYGALEELSGGRAILGLGAGVRYWMEGQLRIPYTKPLEAMREAVEIIRRLFRGEEVNYQGQVFQTSNVRLHFTPPRAQVPIHVGVTSPRNLQLAGEIGDGVVLGFVSSPAYTRHAMEQVRAGAARAGRSLDGFAVTIYLTISIAEDDRAAREVVKPFLATCLALMGDYAEAPLFTRSGLDPDEVRRFGAVYRKEGQPPTRLVTDQIIDALAIAGSPERCRDALQRFVDAGVTSAVAFEIPGVSVERTVREVHQHLMGEFL